MDLEKFPFGLVIAACVIGILVTAGIGLLSQKEETERVSDIEVVVSEYNGMPCLWAFEYGKIVGFTCDWSEYQE